MYINILYSLRLVESESFGYMLNECEESSLNSRLSKILDDQQGKKPIGQSNHHD